MLLLPLVGACKDSLSAEGEAAIDFILLAMAGDLRRLADAEATYYDANGTYTILSSQLGLEEWPTPGVNLYIAYSSAVGWGAVAETPVSSRKCAIYVGPAPTAPLVPGLALSAGTPACQR